MSHQNDSSFRNSNLEAFREELDIEAFREGLAIEGLAIEAGAVA